MAPWRLMETSPMGISGSGQGPLIHYRDFEKLKAAKTRLVNKLIMRVLEKTSCRWHAATNK